MAVDSARGTQQNGYNLEMCIFNLAETRKGKVKHHPYYEPNMDTPDHCDPATLRRGTVVAVASAVFTAKAVGTEALKLMSEI